MKPLRVWAPKATRLEVALNGQRYSLVREGGSHNWWRLEAVGIEEFDDYALFVDGQGPFPDPRSRWQPRGVHGPSRMESAANFAWSDHGFRPRPLAQGLIYELHIGTFTPAGTFSAAIERLDHLAALGVTHVELMPLAEFSGARGWGYDGVDLFAPHHHYGTPAELKALIDQCHRRGLAVLLDVVYNHFGPSGNYLPRFAPYLTDRYSTPWGEAVNVDGPGSDQVRRFFCDNACYWLAEYHFDGLRLDAVHAIIDSSPLHLMEQLQREVASLGDGRPRLLIEENDRNDPRGIMSPARGGYGLDAQWNDDFHHALHSVLTGERSGYYSDFGSLSQLAKVLRAGYVYDGQYSPYRDRIQGRPACGLSGNNFVGYLQNHDQVGNRAQGERSSQLMPLGRLKIGAALVLTAPFVPMLFQGEEWGASTPFLYFSDHAEPDLARAVSEGRRREFAAFGWNPASVPDPQAAATFIRSKLRWEELAVSPHRELLQWYRALIQLRSASADLQDGRMSCVNVTYDEAQGWIVIQRGAIGVAVNLGSAPVRLPWPAPSRLLMGSTPAIRIATDFLELPPDSVAISTNQP
ncbi:MAG TPA: malto-oligosyltrehalose trehalohydrolase [Candidatus Binataceae bacterium]|nr:malto-oligosyltrehalose trehalohydrolase [Candidatus Binataceae bacterium]